MVTLQEIEILATLLQRAGVTQIEAYAANIILERLRAWAATEEMEQREEVASNSRVTQE